MALRSRPVTHVIDVFIALIHVFRCRGVPYSLKNDEKVVYPQAAPFMHWIKHSKTGSVERQRMNKVLMRIL